MIQTQIKFCTSQVRLTNKPFLGKLRLRLFGKLRPCLESIFCYINMAWEDESLLGAKKVPAHFFGMSLSGVNRIKVIGQQEKVEAIHY